jgi:hypothetical protein
LLLPIPLYPNPLAPVLTIILEKTLLSETGMEGIFANLSPRWPSIPLRSFANNARQT